jgi:hypothetical protein
MVVRVKLHLYHGRLRGVNKKNRGRRFLSIPFPACKSTRKKGRIAKGMGVAGFLSRQVFADRFGGGGVTP